MQKCVICGVSLYFLHEFLLHKMLLFEDSCPSSLYNISYTDNGNVKLQSKRTPYTVSLYLVILPCCIAVRCCTDTGLFLYSCYLCFSLSAGLSLMKYIVN